MIKISNIFQAKRMVVYHTCPKIFENILTVCPVPPTPFPLSRLADLMEEHQEELATIESIDSGAVYTLALKTHVGMSIQTFRYFAGWCDKIQVHLDKCFVFLRHPTHYQHYDDSVSFVAG